MSFKVNARRIEMRRRNIPTRVGTVVFEIEITLVPADVWEPEVRVSRLDQTKLAHNLSTRGWYYAGFDHAKKAFVYEPKPDGEDIQIDMIPREKGA